MDEAATEKSWERAFHFRKSGNPYSENQYFSTFSNAKRTVLLMGEMPLFLKQNSALPSPLFNGISLILSFCDKISHLKTFELMPLF